MSQPRFARFVREAGGDRHLALRLYVWNARLCEEFYVPIQFAEVALRNIIHQRLRTLYGGAWYSLPAFITVIPDRHKTELSKLVAAERSRLGPRFTANDVVAGLTFGFWHNLMGHRLEFRIWRRGVHGSFRHLPPEKDREDIYQCVERLRKFRNAIMHHYPIFDQGPTSEYQNIQTLLSWMCPETNWLMKELANPAAVLQRKPRSVP